MKRHIRRGLVLASLAVSLAAPAVAQADVLNDWNVIAQNQAIAIRPTAHGQTRGIAMVQGAVYDAVNAIAPAYKPYLLDLAKLKAQPFGSQDAAIATAAHNVLVAIVDPARVAELDAAYAEDTRADSIRRDEGRRHPRRSRGGRGDARRAGDRRVPRAVHVRSPCRCRPVAAAHGNGDGPRCLGRKPEAVRDREPVAVPLQGAERAHEHRVHEGLRRGEGDRVAQEHDPNGGPDDGGDLLAVAARPCSTTAWRAISPPPVGSTHAARPASSRW